MTGSSWETSRKEVRAERWCRMGGEEGRQAPERKRMRSRMIRKDAKTWVRATYVFERMQTRWLREGRYGVLRGKELPQDRER